MFLRKAFVALGPLLLCLLLCVLYRWLDTLLAAERFLPYLIKGLLLGAGLALLFPVAGIRTQNTGLTGWLFCAAGLLAILLTLQALSLSGTLTGFGAVNGQVVLTESATAGFTLLTALLNRPSRG